MKNNQNKILLKQQEERNQFQQILLHTQLEIQEQTFKNISQEIHDNIGQMLSLAKLNLNRMDPGRHDDLVQKIQDSKNLLGKAIQDLRDLARSMNTDNISSMGLMKAIAYELELVQKAGSHQTALDITGTEIQLDSKKELILFRMLQESLNNIIKHAEAKTIEVKARYTGSFLELQIVDDGKGFDAGMLEEDNTDRGLGIRNMRNRAQLIGAEYQLQSSVGKGTLTTIRLPLQ